MKYLESLRLMHSQDRLHQEARNHTRAPFLKVTGLSSRMDSWPRISHFDLFSRIPNADWKGCVEARPEPFDVDVTPPSPGRPNTLFVPYFWPDETSALVQGRAHHNNYLPDGPLPPGWTYTHTSGRVHAYATTYSLFKYDSVTPAIILESPPSTLGPNKACPDEIMPLTTNMDALVGKIRSLSHWHGGGTIGSEGLMWGWRTLHPELPFDQGVAYGSARKILIFFTDGKNTINANGPGGPVSSDYSAYGHLTSSRFGVSTFSALEEKLDERMRRACTNIKAAGIEVYSVIFREQSGTARDLVRECASGVENHFLAVNEAELLSAFENIANSISSQRIAR
jgi:hypothetical protein